MMMSLKRVFGFVLQQPLARASFFKHSELCRYEEYLDSQITAKDISYLEDVEIVRTLVELGYEFPQLLYSFKHGFRSRRASDLFNCRLRGNGEVVKREEFERRRAADLAARNARLIKKPSKLSSQGKDLSQYPLLQVSRRALLTE
jgi:Domain of unknown function (DUF4464)